MIHMAKDWEFHKARHLEDARKKAKENIEIAELATSPIEKIAGLELLKLYTLFPAGECKLHPQVMIGKYDIDFLVTYEIPGTGCEHSIIIECDGMDFHGTKEQAAKDKARDRYLVLEGYEVLRYTGSEICDDPGRILEDVKVLIQRYRGTF